MYFSLIGNYFDQSVGKIFICTSLFAFGIDSIGFWSYFEKLSVLDLFFLNDLSFKKKLRPQC